MNNPITEQLKKVASDVLTDDTLEGIETAFNEAVESKSEELAALRVDKALVEQDEEHAVKLEKLLEAIDADHTSKLEKVVEAINKNHAEKLLKVVEKCQTEVQEDAGEFKESVVDNISNYLDLYLEKAVPVQDIQEAVKNQHAVRVLENLRKALSIDTALSNEQVREAVIDGKKQIDEATDQQAKLAAENKVLREKVKVREAKLALEKLTDGLPASKKRHMYKVLDQKDADFINENFQYVLEMFEKTELDKLNVLKEEATEGKKIADRPVAEKQEIVEETVDQQIEQSTPGAEQNNLFNNYMGELNKW